jgi:hypothetical protein
MPAVLAEQVRGVGPSARSTSQLLLPLTIEGVIQISEPEVGELGVNRSRKIRTASLRAASATSGWIR